MDLVGMSMGLNWNLMLLCSGRSTCGPCLPELCVRSPFSRCVGSGRDLDRVVEGKQRFGVAGHDRPTTTLRAVDDMRSDDIAPRLIALLQQRADRARLRGVNRVHDRARQAEQDVHTEL